MRTLIFWICATASAQPVFTDVFPSDEYAARRGRVMSAIGDGVAVLQGTTERPGEQPLRQSNQFFYLCGVVEPRAILVIDGKTKRTTLYLQPRSEMRESRMYGPSATVTGMDAVLARSEFAGVEDGRVIYTPFRPEVLGSASASDPRALATATKNDPWDGRGSREEAFRAKLKERAPGSEIRDLDPVLDAMRGTKSAREIAILREATRIAGLGIIEGMRDARPGMKEYELQADCEFVFKKLGAYGPAYFALVAAGQNTWYSHYHKGTGVLEDGDLVQLDYAPDFKNYSSDVTRVFPANGKFSAWQREYYGIYLKLYQALMTSIEVHRTAAEIMRKAAAKMDAEIAAFPFTDQRVKAAAVKFADGYRNPRANASLGHTVGMEVHDVRNPTPTLEAGQVFTIEPAMLIPEMHLGIRLEDMILITETGYENLSAFVPVGIQEIEALMKPRRGLSDALWKEK
jgi:Xaa-Pro aminopeptidase